MNARFCIRVTISLLLVSTLLIPSVYATTEKRYFTTDTDTIDAITYKLLKTVETGTEGTVSDSIVTVGPRASAIVGIRVWILHNDNSMDEVTAGTPVAQCTFTSIEGRVTHSNTWACPETVMIVTDHVLVVVFWDRCTAGASWIQIGASSFMTEELGTTILNGATWTVQYECHFTSIPTFPFGSYRNEMTFYFDGIYDSWIDNFVWGVVDAKEWHDIAWWNFTLITREWLTVSTWNFNLSTMQWTDVATWSFNLTTMAWQNIVTWAFELSTIHISIFFIGLLTFFGLVFLALVLARREDD